MKQIVKKLGLSMISGVMILSLAGCGAPAPEMKADASGRVTVADAMETIKQQNPKLVIMDVRTQYEYAQGHLSKAINVDYKMPDFENAISKMDKNNTYLVYCRTGRRSEEAQKTMQSLGFQHVYNLDGGMIKWSMANGPLFK
jgi:rhodanese-related sulfurtransferase